MGSSSVGTNKLFLYKLPESCCLRYHGSRNVTKIRATFPSTIQVTDSRRTRETSLLIFCVVSWGNESPRMWAMQDYAYSIAPVGCAYWFSALGSTSFSSRRTQEGFLCLLLVQENYSHYWRVESMSVHFTPFLSLSVPAASDVHSALPRPLPTFPPFCLPHANIPVTYMSPLSPCPGVFVPGYTSVMRKKKGPCMTG